MDIVADTLNEQFFEGIALVVFALIVKKYNLHERAKNFKVWSRRPNWGEWKVAGMYVYTFASVAATCAFFVLMVLFTKFGPNIILLRVATGFASGANFTAQRGAGHYLVWVALFAVWLRWGGKDVIKAGYTMTAFGAIHELMWYLAYVWTNPANWARIEPYYTPFFVFSAGCLFGWLYLFRPSVMSWKKFGLALAFMACFYVLWTAAGFPISIDNVIGPTSNYGNIVVNLVEDLSWTTWAFMWM
jgi:hypothetical protein